MVTQVKYLSSRRYSELLSTTENSMQAVYKLHERSFLSGYTLNNTSWHKYALPMGIRTSVNIRR